MAGAMATGLGESQRVSKMRRLTDKCHCSTKQTIRDRERRHLPIDSSDSRLEGEKNRVFDTCVRNAWASTPALSPHDSKCRLTFVEESSWPRQLSRDWRYLEGRWTWVVVVVLRLERAPSSRGTWAQCPSARWAS